jgi:glycosyltransferase involved in cell wall biosynthesis
LVSGVDPFAAKRRVLHVAQPGEGGVARYVHEVSTAHAARGWDVHLAGPYADGAVGPAGVTTHIWRAERSPLRGVNAERRALGSIIAAVDPDVVVLHSSKAGLIGRLVVRAERPTVFIPHAWSFLALPPGARAAARAWERAASCFTNAVVAGGDGEAETGVRAGVRAPTFVVRHGVPSGWRYVPDHERASQRAALELPTSGPLVVCVGRLCRQKGQDVLMAAWRRVISVCPDAWLVVVGGSAGHLRVTMPERVVIAGHQDPRGYVAAADVVAMPSRWEGCPLVMLEALATGRSVVMTDVAGSEVVTRAGAGAVVRRTDADAFARALVSRLQGTIDVLAEGRRGAAYVDVHHRADAAQERLAAVIGRAHAFGHLRRRGHR